MPPSNTEVEKHVRPSWDDYFLGMLSHVASRATCDRGRCAAIIARGKRLIATGYVGAPPGLPHCDDVGHMLKRVIDEDGTERQHCMRTVHAEQNAICQAARYGIALEDATLYVGMEPCRVCAMLIISVGIKRVVCERRYHAAQETREMFDRCGIELVVLEDEVVKYDRM